jgi:hypothetical protein
MLGLLTRSRFDVAHLLVGSVCSALQQTQQQQLAKELHTCSPSSLASSNFSDDHKFVGAYTPVTKQLWLDRLKKAEQQQHQAAAGAFAGAAEQAAAKPPQLTRVEYPFTKDKFLLEMVRGHCWLMMWHGIA